MTVSTKIFRCVAALLCCAAASISYAQEDFREISLNDGRVFVGEVIATEPAGLRTKLPQGTLLVPYHQLQDMLPVDRVRFDQQRQWLIYVAGGNSDHKKAMQQAVAEIPHVQVYGDTGTEGALNSLHLSRGRQCKDDLQCVSGAMDTGYWVWIMDFVEGQGQVVLRGTLNTNAAVYEIELDSWSQEGLVPALYEMMSLDAPSAAEAEQVAEVKPDKSNKKPGKDKNTGKTKEPAPKGVFSEEKVFALSFVPIPGYSSLAQGDKVGFALSMAIVVPATVGWIGATGKNAQSAPEHIAMALGGFYVATVAVNQMLGARSRNRNIALGLQPATRKGKGAMVSLSVALK